MNIHNPEPVTGSPLTPLQQQRYDYLFPFYGKHAATIVTNLYGKGKNSWAVFLEKMDTLMEAKPHVKAYYNALYDAFDLNRVYTTGQLIANVNDARRQMSLVPYTERIKSQSEHDFNLIFLVEDVNTDSPVDGVMKKTFFGFKPIAKVTPE